MGIAIYIVLDNTDPGFSTLVSGKAVALEVEALDTLAIQIGFTPLSEFVSVSSEDLMDLIGDEVEVPVPDERWFAAEEGLRAIRALADGIEANPGHVIDSAAVLLELREYEAVLSNAQTIGARWHLAYDV